MSAPYMRYGAPPQGPAEISYRQATDHHQHSGADRPGRRLPTPLIEYGRDSANLDLWLDRDGQVYHGRGPYERRPLRWARRKVAHWRAALLRERVPG